MSLSQFHLLLYIEITPIIFIIISFCKFSCNKICNSFNNFLWEKSLSTKRPIFSHLSLCFCVVVGMDNHYLKCFKVVSLALENNKCTNTLLKNSNLTSAQIHFLTWPFLQLAKMISYDCKNINSSLFSFSTMTYHLSNS